MSRAQTIVTSIGAGAVAGGLMAGAAIAFSARWTKAAVGHSSIASVEVAPAAPADLSGIERELQELRERTRAQPAPDGNGALSAAGPGARGNVYAEEPQIDPVVEYRAAVDAHTREQPDSRWASTEARVISEDLTRDSDAGMFSVEKVDCRTTTCVADVRFDSFHSAQLNWGRILNGRRIPGCGVEVVLDNAPKDMSQPYETSVFFNCIGTRAGE
jgi:hypothetical protein